MTYAIDKMSLGTQEAAKNQLELQMQRRGFGYGLDNLDPYIIGVDIGAGAVVVTLRDDAPYYVADSIPTELTDSFEGLPIDIEFSAPLHHLQRGPASRGGGGGVLEGGDEIFCLGKKCPCYCS